MSNKEYTWPLFWPTIPDQKKLFAELRDTMETRWIGQGPKVTQFEHLFASKFDAGFAVATSSCTAALHLAYRLAHIEKGDKVISSVLTCTAANHALLMQGAEILFCDIDPKTLNPDPAYARMLCEKYDVRAIVPVHLGGQPCDIGGFSDIAVDGDIPIIYDAAQALGAQYGGQSIDAPLNCGIATCHSFQAIKHLTTGDGGMICLPTWRKDGADRVRKLRWFAIDREAREKEFDWKPWANRSITVDQTEIGYKYQMTDLDACWGLVGLQDIEQTITHRRDLAQAYRHNLLGFDGLVPMDEPGNTACSYSLYGCIVDRRDDFCEALESKGVETNVVQLRNDIYTVFGGKRQDLPAMNEIEDKYIYLPLNSKITQDDVAAICQIVKEGW